MLAVAQFACAVAINVALTGSAEAQRYQRGGSFFERLFGGFRAPPIFREQDPSSYDSSRAPPPKEAPDVEPTTNILVMGDAMANWLAYGLEETFEETPEIAITRENEPRSGLVRYKYRSDLDWWHVARDVLNKHKKVDYVVMMLGVYDRRSIQNTDKDEPEPGAPVTDDNNQQPQIMSEEKPAQSGPASFRSERWATIYTRRIDATLAALRSKGVPVLWVGLPSIRGTRSTADAVYLNDLYRARAERAGAIYVDVWDGFIDENGKFTYHGPDYEGQTRRLRAGDGVYFTKAGARKLAHYVERELRRLMANRASPVALPSGGAIGPLAPNAPRPLAGPVVPLTVLQTNATELVGGPRPQSVRTDPIANQVLVKGEPMEAAPGRADDFAWPRDGTAEAAAAAANAPADAKPSTPAAAAKPADKKKPNAPGKVSQAAPATPKTTGSDSARAQPVRRDVPRPPRPVGRSNFDPFRGLR